MFSATVATQPLARTNLQAMVDVLANGPWKRADIAVAYATSGGVELLLDAAAAEMGGDWLNLPKRWLVGFDYCRSEPVALKALSGLENSEVRVPNGMHIVKSPGCRPSTVFHPKAIVLSASGRGAVFAGSGNMSRSGLRSGYELGLGISFSAPKSPFDVPARGVHLAACEWFQTQWNAASKLSPSLLSAYTTVYNSIPNLTHPTPTDDDGPQPNDSAFTEDDLVQLRTCTHLWIECWKITRNRGKDKPGNQLMMSPYTRVFFGAPATEVPRNSPLRDLEIQYGGGPFVERSLTFSDNSMDKLTLPVPGTDGPEEYDYQNLLFTRIEPGRYRLEIGTDADKAIWTKRSEIIGALHEMTSGRTWGVF